MVVLPKTLYITEKCLQSMTPGTEVDATRDNRKSTWQVKSQLLYAIFCQFMFTSDQFHNITAFHKVDVLSDAQPTVLHLLCTSTKLTDTCK